QPSPSTTVCDLDAPTLERVTVNLHNPRGAKGPAPRDEQGCLGESVAWEETSHAEPIRLELLREELDRLGTDRLGAIEGDAPGGEIEPFDLLGADALTT